MKKRRYLLPDLSARIPFSILGIFILLSSSITTVYISDFDTQNTDQYITSLKGADIEQLLYRADADIASMINTVGLKSLQEIGKTPVMESSDLTQTGQDVNKLRLKKSVVSMLNQLLILNFRGDKFNNGRYAINVIINQSQTYPIEDLNNVKITSINMTVNRPIHIPLIGPDQTENGETYWKIDILLKFEIRSLQDDEVVGEYYKEISKVITSRYPMLYYLTEEYNTTLQSLGPFWGFVTAVSNIYSLARGYKHYSSGKPMNVVDNKHLAPIINAGLLFEQGLSFGSIDPNSLIDLISECKTAFFNKTSTNSIASLNSIDQPSFSIPKSWFSTIPSNIANDDDINTTIDQCPQINISEIASMIIYNYQTIEIIFKQLYPENIYSTILSNPSSEDIKNCINSTIDDNNILLEVNKKDIYYNLSSLNTVNNLINLTYNSSFETCVIRDPAPNVEIGPHDGYPIDNGTTSWEISSTILINTIQKPPKNNISIDTILYEEIYDIIWTRSHHWSKKETYTSGNISYTNWSFFSATDHKTEENVSLQIIVRKISPISYGGFPIKDVFYENVTLDDLNLEDTLDIYYATVFDVNTDELLENANGCYYPRGINGSYGSWVYNDALESIDEILDIIRSIKQNESINSSRYSNPLTLLEKSKEDLILKYENLMPLMIDENSYLKDNTFISAGNKAVYCVRSWFVDTSYEYIIKMFDEAIEKLDSSFSDSLEEYGFQQQEDVLSMLDGSDEGSFISDSFAIPFGIPLELQSEESGMMFGWNESLHLSVNQFPKYLSPFTEEKYEGKDEYFLSIRNTCILGPTGIPILPITPATPWIVTLNIWLLSIRGSYAEFILADGNDETIPNPIFGHDSQVMIRENKDILDENGDIIGMNTRISFEFDTVCFSIVPSFGMMVGDKDGNLMEEDGYEK
ncbi:MAG: hypothetical protein DRN27_01325 [Thermoplasmata archaeon]|nr:MAG: hypothetical protein DRN27_01325 [Thermoplasmata archaeon]